MLSDPIAALATAPGRAALAVIRASGAGVFEVAARVVSGFAVQPARSARLATFTGGDGTPLDRGLYLTFPGPHSYTGEDLVELTCHGGLLVPAQLLAALQAAGARPAAPGEFTRRALLNGKLDLLQAEAVGDLVDATAPFQARAALRQLDGGLSRRIEELRAHLVDLLALLSYEVDFPEEDDGPLPRRALRERLGALEAEVETLLATAPAGERLREGALVVLAGRPNAGKSSLFNALLGTARAIVSEVPGTTRDTIEAYTDLDGWPVRLADTAGLGEPEDRLGQLGVEVSRQYVAQADLVLLCVESGRDVGADELRVQSAYPTLVVRTKSDLAPPPGPSGSLAVSARTGEGIGALRDALLARLFPGNLGRRYADLEPLLTRERHRTALARAAASLRDGAPHLASGGDAVLAAHHVRMAGLALDELIGVVDVEDVLDRVFGSFCVGK